MTNGTSISTLGAAIRNEWMTATNLVLIAIGMVLALLVIWWGARLKRQRKAAERELADNQGIKPAAETIAEVAPPVAPAPPPLAGDSTPIVAAAPFDASPAAVAADLETALEVSAAADDLTQMKGVGPRLAVRLGELGLTRYAQIAALDPAEAAALDAQLGAFAGRLTRDRWIEQAGYLARGDRDGFEAAFGKL